MTNMPKEARDKMLYAALHLFTTKGFKETSILEIVEQARVSKTTFYQYFKSKEELLVSLFQQLAEEIIKAVESAVQQEKKVTYKAYAGIRRYIEICVDRSTVAQLLLVESVGVSQAVEKVRREAHRRLADLIYQIVKNVIPASVSTEEVRIVSQAMVGAINEVVVQNLFESGQDVQIDGLARLLNRIVVGSYVNLSLKDSKVLR
ncbi:TetR/AcrR family transcriptional regulator [Lihuaxuella thermophila]|uniref:TetR/AcrR family transcriptional regulator n=1 Tax=Lihuaxuella thermophila TaxID=1173111 RepID=UPI001FCDD0C4|nr:TetR/AcrR family transcriptional regulator [Lihuaxuella thermophila]